MKIGKLYSYSTGRNMFSNPQHAGDPIDFIEIDEPFMLLETTGIQPIESVKVLSAQGIIGYIYIGYPENLTELSHQFEKVSA